MSIINPTFKYKCKWDGNVFERNAVYKNGIKVPPNAVKCRKCGNFIPRLDFI